MQEIEAEPLVQARWSGELRTARDCSPELKPAETALVEEVDVELQTNRFEICVKKMHKVTRK